SWAAATRAATSRISCPRSPTTRGACSRSARPGTGWRRPSAGRCPSRPARRCRPRSRARRPPRCRATPCCSRAPARPSTCSATTQSAAAPTRKRCAGWPAKTRMARKLSTDLTLVAVTVALLGFGLVMVWSASSVLAQERNGSAYHFLLRQGMWAVIGLAVMVAALRLDYRRLRHPAVVYSVVGTTTLLLILVL